MRRLSMLWIVFLTLFLISCEDTQLHKKIQQQILAIKKQETSIIESLPKFPRINTITYQADDLPDPFQPQKKFSQQIKQKDYQNIKPFLESYSLNALYMVGWIEKNGQLWGLILAPNKTIYAITKSQHIGKNNGKIIDITMKQIIVEEKVLLNNVWKKRTVQLSLGKL